MKNFDLPLFNDTIFTAVAMFILTFGITLHYTHILWLSIFVAVLSAIIASALFFGYMAKKRQRSILLTTDQKNKNKLAIHLALLTNKQAFISLKNILPIGTIEDDNVWQNQEELFYPLFHLKALEIDEVLDVVKRSFDQKTTLLCNQLSPDAKSFLQQFNIQIWQLNDIYQALKDKDLLPERYLGETNKKIVWWKRKNLLNKNVSLPFLKAGILLMSVSFLTIFPLYYLITGGLFLVLALLSRILPQFNEI